MLIDIISDLHIDQWNSKIYTKYPLGNVVDSPFKLPKSDARVLIIAGDIADDIDESMKYLNKLSKTNNYDKILFIDGNHEHVNSYPMLFDVDEIYKKIKSLKNNKVTYLPKSPVKFGNTIIIGCCGWGDYENKKQSSINKNMMYFKHWIPSFTKTDNKKFINNVIKQSEKDYCYLRDQLDIYENKSNIKNIIVVTHTVPLEQFCTKGTDAVSVDLNTKFIKLLRKYTKITHWVFGHTHDSIECKIEGVHFICNPRGRPVDMNRTRYYLKTIEI